MRFNVYSVFDVAAGAYLPPFFVHAEPLAVRMFADSCVSADHAFAKHAEDYTLFCLGTFEDTTAIFDHHAPRKVMNGLEAVSMSRKVDGAQLALIDDELGDTESEST